MAQRPAARPLIDATVLAVRVTPHSGKDEVSGWSGGELRARVRAPAAGGQANQALLALLASRLGLSASALSLVGSRTARVKRVRVQGLGADEVRRRLSGA